jgi:hypothetical protein
MIVLVTMPTVEGHTRPFQVDFSLLVDPINDVVELLYFILS